MLYFWTKFGFCYVVLLLMNLLFVTSYCYWWICCLLRRLVTDEFAVCYVTLLLVNLLFHCDRTRKVWLPSTSRPRPFSGLPFKMQFDHKDTVVCVPMLVEFSTFSGRRTWTPPTRPQALGKWQHLRTLWGAEQQALFGDRVLLATPQAQGRWRHPHTLWGADQQAVFGDRAVSYTHLTLPTTASV